MNREWTETGWNPTQPKPVVWENGAVEPQLDDEGRVIYEPELDS